jgi:hypothetical protein
LLMSRVAPPYWSRTGATCRRMTSPFACCCNEEACPGKFKNCPEGPCFKTEPISGGC